MMRITLSPELIEKIDNRKAFFKAGPDDKTELKRWIQQIRNLNFAIAEQLNQDYEKEIQARLLRCKS